MRVQTASSHSLSKLWGDIQTFVAVLRIILQRPAVYPLGWQAERRRIAGEIRAPSQTATLSVATLFLTHNQRADVRAIR